jgi:acetyl-CoA carboxylase carboxyl transferase subunit beta
MTLELAATAAARTDGSEPAIRIEWDADLTSQDPLGFPGYLPPAAREDSVRTGLGRIGQTDVAVIECRFDHRGGTMGAAAGERIVRAFGRATDNRLPMVEFVSSGGARLEEGMVSLVQMARSASAVAAHGAAGLTTAAVLRSPTTGGVFASWASLSDFRAAEPGATVGFAGPRVVKQVTGVPLPASSHTAESALAAGLVDAVVASDDADCWLAAILGVGAGRPLPLEAWRPAAPDSSAVPVDGWELLRRTRSAGRASGIEWASWLTDSWVDMRGSDPSMRAGLATIGGTRAVVIAMDRTAAQRLDIRPGPAAFRLAQRALSYADRTGLPVLTLIDTPGADPAPESEAGGIAGEIARTLLAMARLRSTSVAVCVGEGGSGGAMALAHADAFLLLQGAPFSVIGPEAGAAILYRDSSRAPELTRAFRMRPTDLLEAGVVDAVVAEDVAAVRAAVLSRLGHTRAGARDARASVMTHRALGLL